MLKRREDAEEALQDAFIRAYNALDKFGGASKFSTWFYRILYNVCLTRIGKKNETFQVVDYSDEESYGEQESMYGELDYETRELAAQVKKIIEIMPEKYCAILTMFYLQEMSHQEICEVTNLPLGTVKTHLFRARAILQERLFKELHYEGVV
jgi:RNA polymerase sigma-70 factor (ECF subfamily)